MKNKKFFIQFRSEIESYLYEECIESHFVLRSFKAMICKMWKLRSSPTSHTVVVTRNYTPTPHFPRNIFNKWKRGNGYGTSLSKVVLRLSGTTSGEFLTKQRGSTPTISLTLMIPRSLGVFSGTCQDLSPRSQTGSSWEMVISWRTDQRRWLISWTSILWTRWRT